MTKARKLAYLCLIGNVIIWGAALPIVKPALSYITPFQFLFFRYAIATAILIIPSLIWFRSSLKLKNLKSIIPLEFLQIIISLSILYIALSFTSALEAALIGTTGPIFVTIGGIIFLKEKEERREWLGLIISVIGTLIIIISPFLSSRFSASFSPLGIGLMILYNIINAIYLLIAKTKYQNINKLPITAVGSIIGFIGFFIITYLLSTPPEASHLAIPSVAFAALYMGILGTPIALSLYLYGQNHIEASEAALFTYLQPLVYIPLTLLWLGESILPAQIIGLLIIVTGVFLAERRPNKTSKKAI